MKFDARVAKALKPGEHIIVDGCPGLRMEASQTRRTWIYRYKSPVDGKMRQKSIGHWPAIQLPAALTAWQEMREQRDRGIDVVLAAKQVKAAAPKPTPSGYTVRTLVDEYLAGHIDVNRKLKGAAEVRRLMDKNLGDLGEMQVSDVKRSVAFKFLEGLISTPVQAGYIRQELGAAWSYSLDAGRMPDETPNWWREIMRGRLRSKGRTVKGKKVGPIKRALSESELGQLIRWLPNFPALTDDVVTLYLWTGTRGAEIVAMEAEEITREDDGMWWTIPKAKTKSANIDDATDLRVPLVGRAKVVVERLLVENPKGYLFPSRVGGHVQQKTVGVAIWSHMPDCTIRPDWSRPRLPVASWAAHDLRRTARTMLASLGCPDSVAEAILGHLQPGIQGVYNMYAYDKERRLWLKKLDAHLEKLARKT